MKLADLNWGDILSKVAAAVAVATVPIIMGQAGLKRESTSRASLEARHDSLLAVFGRYHARDSLRDTTQGRAIRQLQGKVRRGATFAASDTVLIMRKPMPWYKRWWASMTRRDST